MKASEAHPGQKIQWTKESKTFVGTVEDWQVSAVVRVWDGRHTLAIAPDREVEVVE